MRRSEASSLSISMIGMRRIYRTVLLIFGIILAGVARVGLPHRSLWSSAKHESHRRGL
ncbi:hypothetical protein BDV59DRAFT_179654 [Aspergillus ambiguus]|uniref:uncharacterized protein n=1 Tax=Aspergillus ambiguus TaxID=176160 RepID=UPI003CCDBA40